MQFGFQWFLNQENWKKPKKNLKKTLKQGNLETHVRFSKGTCLQGLAKLSLGKLIPDLTLY